VDLVVPASLPNAFPTNTPPATLSRKDVAGMWQDRGDAGADAVSLDEGHCPTRTPATSVMAFKVPGGKTPGAMPISRARGRVSRRGGGEDGRAAHAAQGRREGEGGGASEAPPQRPRLLRIAAVMRWRTVQ
jgi:hypothetical protein